ncbi:MAG: sigma-70 family RNA polymerase sigma factor [Bacteroidota bacterium]
MALTDKELLELLAGSKTDRDRALGEIYRANREKVCSYILGNSGSMDEATDVFQESVIAFYENVRDGKFKGESKIGTYLYSIAKFKWLNQIKKNNIRSGHHEKASMATVVESPMVPMLEQEQQHRVKELLGALGESCKQLLVENLYHNASMKEIAASGGYSSEQIVRNKKYKCLQKLKALINEKPALKKVLLGYE